MPPEPRSGIGVHAIEKTGKPMFVEPVKNVQTNQLLLDPLSYPPYSPERFNNKKKQPRYDKQIQN